MAKGYTRSERSDKGGKHDSKGHKMAMGLPVHVASEDGSICKHCGKSMSKSDSSKRSLT